jgi:hypothetical protein
MSSFKARKFGKTILQWIWGRIKVLLISRKHMLEVGSSKWDDLAIQVTFHSSRNSKLVT